MQIEMTHIDDNEEYKRKLTFFPNSSKLDSALTKQLQWNTSVVGWTNGSAEDRDKNGKKKNNKSTNKSNPQGIGEPSLRYPQTFNH